jgi:uncharacterized surface protein with fasciclin (FAS1) repeats
MVDRNRRRFVRSVGALGGVLSVGGIGVASAKKGARGDDTIVDLAIDADGFDVLVAAVQEAGLVDVLSGTRQLTVFAPTDAAFNDADISVDNVDTFDTSFLVNVLTYHVTPGRRYAASILRAPQVPTLNGASVAVDGTTLNEGQAEIQANLTDLEAGNGVVHVIDGVLTP